MTILLSVVDCEIVVFQYFGRTGLDRPLSRAI